MILIGKEALKLAMILIIYFSHFHEPPREDIKPLAEEILEGRPKVFAFRGGALEGKENSLSAIQHSIELGVDGIHFDVSMTADGFYVVADNHSPSRVLGRPDTIDQLSREELGVYEDVTVGYYGDVFMQENKENEGIPDLDAVIHLLSQEDNEHVSIIVSTDIDDLKALVVMIVEFEEAGLLERTAFNIPFDNSEIQEHIKSKVTFTNRKNDTKELVSIYDSFFQGTGIETFKERGFDIFLPFYPFNQEVLSLNQLKGGVVVKQAIMDPELDELSLFLQEREKSVGLMGQVANRDGLPFVYGVANTDRDFSKALWLGANAVLTERPSELIGFLRLHGKKRRGDKDSDESDEREDFPRGPQGPRGLSKED